MCKWSCFQIDPDLLRISQLTFCKQQETNFFHHVFRKTQTVLKLGHCLSNVLVFLQSWQCNRCGSGSYGIWHLVGFRSRFCASFFRRSRHLVSSVKCCAFRGQPSYVLVRLALDLLWPNYELVQATGTSLDASINTPLNATAFLFGAKAISFFLSSSDVRITYCDTDFGLMISLLRTNSGLKHSNAFTTIGMVVMTSRRLGKFACKKTRFVSRKKFMVVRSCIYCGTKFHSTPATPIGGGKYSRPFKLSRIYSVISTRFKRVGKPPSAASVRNFICDLDQSLTFAGLLTNSARPIFYSTIIVYSILM
jgi:hypothetical protein